VEGFNPQFPLALSLDIKKEGIRPHTVAVTPAKSTFSLKMDIKHALYYVHITFQKLICASSGFSTE